VLDDIVNVVCEKKTLTRHFAPADWKHKPQPMSCSHALSTKEKAPGQQKVP